MFEDNPIVALILICVAVAAAMVYCLAKLTNRAKLPTDWD